MPLSADLAAKSVQAAVAAIEIYNKPSFTYREAKPCRPPEHGARCKGLC
jgi:hypothetical protein